MSQLKKVLITVPEPLLEEVDLACKGENSNRSEFVRRAMKCYLAEKRKAELQEQLARGYQEMADINLELSDVYFDLEEEQFSRYEEKLSECESCGC
ncbi:MAG: ribbon-helix-helix protein, CopG family [Clostridia bacterium]|nr:ribbon-helix-helix protein, CopG family [Clostridia bacterium]